MSDIQFVDGLIAKAPNQGAPDYVKARLSIKRAELAAWLASQPGDWINVEVKESKAGKWYAAVDTWKPDGEKAASKPAPQRPEPAPPADDFKADDIPF